MAEAAGDELVAKAEKKLKGGIFGNMFGNKKDEAVELLQEAANKYKQAKKWTACGETQKRVAELQLQQNDKFGAATAYQAAFQAFKKDAGNTIEAVECLNQAIELHINNGRFTQAAKFHKEAGEMFEADLDFSKAVEHFQNAGDYYKGEDQTSSANQCFVSCFRLECPLTEIEQYQLPRCYTDRLDFNGGTVLLSMALLQLRVAVLSAELEDYPKAIDTFESVASASLDVALLKWSVKDYFFQAGLCHLATGDVVNARRAIDRYQEQDVSFSDTRECKLLCALVDAYEDMDVEKFTNEVYEFDQVSKLDKWKTTVLLRIKNKLKDSDLT